MGDRVLVTFTDNQGDFTPAIYMHWGGRSAPQMIRQAASAMRRGDTSYSAARFCGECHKAMAGLLGLGLLDGPKPDDPGFDWNEYSHGDAGVYIVNVETGEVDAKAGYGEKFTVPLSEWGHG